MVWTKWSKPFGCPRQKLETGPFGKTWAPAPSRPPHVQWGPRACSLRSGSIPYLESLEGIFGEAKEHGKVDKVETL